MPLVLVHGNPETEAVWEDLLPYLAQHEPVRLSPPGFGAPIPAGFDCTIDAYRDWLASEIKQLPRPIDLLGHDWGGGHVLRIAMEQPDLVRSWISDVIGTCDPDYVWHDMAQGWQTPGVGEQMVADMIATPVDDVAKQFEDFGMSANVARKVAAGVNEEMGRALLALYRSAAQPALKERGAHLGNASRKPGLALIPTDDVFTGGEAMARRSAERAKAEVAVLDGLGHWWMCQDPNVY